MKSTILPKASIIKQYEKPTLLSMRSIKFQDVALCAGIVLMYGLLCYTSKDDFFFWDTVQLASLHAHYFLETNFVNWFLPNYLDSGHVPVFGFYIALVWKWFGRSLAVSHMAMWPFVALYLYFLIRLGRFLYGEYWHRPVGLLALLPVMVAQVTLVSPDVVLMASFVWTLYGLFTRKVIHALCGAIILSLISNRGLIVTGALCVSIMIYGMLDKKVLWRMLWPIAVAMLLPIGYHLTHYFTKGWIGYHGGSPWNASFEMATVTGYLKNTILIGWRMVDFMMIVPIGMAAYLLYRKTFTVKPAWHQLYCIILICVGLALAIPGILFKQLTAHRYFLPVMWLVMVQCAAIFQKSALSTRLFRISSLSLLFGHLLVYPTGIAMGWDSTLAYKSFIQQRRQVLDYMTQHDIRQDSVASFFPNKLSSKIIDLEMDTFRMQQFDTTANYVFYSFVHNDMTDAEHRQLKELYQPVFVVQSIFGHRSALYQKKSSLLVKMK